MNRKIYVVIIMFICLSMISSICFASGIDTEDYKNVSNIPNDKNFITNMGSAIFSAVRIAGAAISVIYISILGMRYMTSSIDDRVDIKKRLIPFTIGAVIFFGVTFFMELIIDIAGWI